MHGNACVCVYRLCAIISQTIIKRHKNKTEKKKKSRAQMHVRLTGVNDRINALMLRIVRLFSDSGVAIHIEIYCIN